MSALLWHFVKDEVKSDELENHSAHKQAPSPPSNTHNFYVWFFSPSFSIFTKYFHLTLD